MQENKIVYPIKEEEIVIPQKGSEVAYQVEKKHQNTPTERKN
jgi:hypothetical protein